MFSCDFEDAGWLAWYPRSSHQRQLPSAKVSLGKLLVHSHICHNSSIVIYPGLSFRKLNVMSCAKLFNLA